MKQLATIGQPAALRYGASYKATTAMAALTPDTIFAPGSNTLGAWLWLAYMHSAMGGNNRFAIIAHTAAPGSLTTGDVLALGFSQGTANQFHVALLDTPIFIPAGRGLYMISENLETTAYRSALYTLIS